MRTLLAIDGSRARSASVRALDGHSRPRPACASTLALVALCSLALGCSAQIPDGRIGCHDPAMTCPAGYFCWASTMTCHRMPERFPDGGMPMDSSMPDQDAWSPDHDAWVPPSDGGGVDSGVGGQYQPCGAGGSCTPGTMCLAGQYCSPMCMDSMCPPSPAPTGVCHGPNCLLTCPIPMGGVPDPCPGGSICAVGRWSGTTTSAACTDMATITPANHGTSCASDSMCTAPDACVHGACMRPCSGMGPCGGGTNCAPIPMQPDLACMSMCTSSATCGTNFECVQPPGAPGGNCFPTAWGVAGTHL